MFNLTKPQIESSVETAGEETVLKLCLIEDALPSMAATYPYQAGRKAGSRLHHEAFLPFSADEEVVRLAQLDEAATAWTCAG